MVELSRCAAGEVGQASIHGRLFKLPGSREAVLAAARSTIQKRVKFQAFIRHWGRCGWDTRSPVPFGQHTRVMRPAICITNGEDFIFLRKFPMAVTLDRGAG